MLREEDRRRRGSRQKQSSTSKIDIWNVGANGVRNKPLAKINFFPAVRWALFTSAITAGMPGENSDVGQLTAASVATTMFVAAVHRQHALRRTIPAHPCQGTAFDHYRDSGKDVIDAQGAIPFHSPSIVVIHRVLSR